MITRKQKKEADDLSVECNITMAEALNLIIQSERNEILKTAFVIKNSNDTPTALEAIAIALGLENKGRGN